jgi:sugar phosphate isomerase/epimerase
MIYKNKFPFRIGCTSYVLPDSILPNVELMSDFVDDIELLFFESFSRSNPLDESVLNNLNSISVKKNLSYSIHCPVDCNGGSIDSTERTTFVEQMKLIVDKTRFMNISGYIVHFDGIGLNSSEEEIAVWNENVSEVCNKISTIKNLDLSKICIENLKYRPQLNNDVVNRFGFSLCLDMGHMWLNNHDWKSAAASMISQTKVIHLHGIFENKDHLSLTMHDQDVLSAFIKTVLNNYREVLTIELFNKNAVFESLECLRNLWEKLV